MCFDAQDFFFRGDKTFFFYFLQLDFFPYCKEKIIVPRKENLAARKKMLFFPYTKKKLLASKNISHFCG